VSATTSQQGVGACTSRGRYYPERHRRLSGIKRIRIGANSLNSILVLCINLILVVCLKPDAAWLREENQVQILLSILKTPRTSFSTINDSKHIT
jgi:hypothetical protein